MLFGLLAGGDLALQLLNVALRESLNIIEDTRLTPSRTRIAWLGPTALDFVMATANTATKTVRVVRRQWKDTKLTRSARGVSRFRRRNRAWLMSDAYSYGVGLEVHRKHWESKRSEYYMR